MNDLANLLFDIPDLCTKCGVNDAKYAHRSSEKAGWEAWCIGCATPEVVAAGEQVPLMIEEGVREEIERLKKEEGEE